MADVEIRSILSRSKNAGNFGGSLDTADHSQHALWSDAFLRAKAALAQHGGDAPGAIAYLEEAATLARNIGVRGEQWPIVATLSDLYDGAGNVEKARQARMEATRIIQNLAEMLSDEVLRAVFLSAPMVRHLLTTGNT